MRSSVVFLHMDVGGNKAILALLSGNNQARYMVTGFGIVGGACIRVVFTGIHAGGRGAAYSRVIDILVLDP